MYKMHVHMYVPLTTHTYREIHAYTVLYVVCGPTRGCGPGYQGKRRAVVRTVKTTGAIADGYCMRALVLSTPSGDMSGEPSSFRADIEAPKARG